MFEDQHAPSMALLNLNLSQLTTVATSDGGFQQAHYQTHYQQSFFMFDLPSAHIGLPAHNSKSINKNGNKLEKLLKTLFQC